MALIERLMKMEAPAIPVHTFFAAQQEILSGRLTVAQVKTFLQMNAAAIAEYDALIALAPTGTTTAAIANKALYISGIHAVFLLAESRVPGYDTPTAVRIKLGL